MEAIKIGGTYNHRYLGKVVVLSKVEKSRTKYNVECVDRGPGWDEKTKSYKGVKNSVGWYRGENRQFGHQDIVHKNELT